MAENSKDTIYVDVEDEITTIIDKVAESTSSLVALVLPKRASVFQSVVNMKLLKRKSDEAGKRIVLITTESSLLPLAGSIGIHVAKTLSSKPEIPDAPVFSEAPVLADEDEPINIDEREDGDVDLTGLAAAPIGALAAEDESKKSPTRALDKDIETVELDNLVEDRAEDSHSRPAAMPKGPSKPSQKDKKLKVPNFDKFRVILVAVVVLIILLGGGLVLALGVLPHATISIKTNAQNVATNISLTLSQSASSLNTTSDVVPAKLTSETKTYSATVNSTGQQNEGQTATGTVTMSAEACGAINQPADIPAGSQIVQNNQTYITQNDTAFSFQGFKGNCILFTSNSNTNITAQNPGTAYNTQNNNTQFTVNSSNEPQGVTVSAVGGASGGTDNNVTVVSQSDITNAQNKITTSSSSAKSDLENALTQAGYYPITATFVSGTPNVTPSATAGTATNSVTVTETVKYSMYGAKKSDLQKLLNSNIRSQATSNQSILNNGFSSASYSVNSSPNSVNMQTTAIVGPNISVASIKKEAEGKKMTAVEDRIKQNPDVTSVYIKLSPFYVSTVPKNPAKIHVTIAKPTNSTSNGG